MIAIFSPILQLIFSLSWYCHFNAQHTHTHITEWGHSGTILIGRICKHLYLCSDKQGKKPPLHLSHVTNYNSGLVSPHNPLQAVGVMAFPLSFNVTLHWEKMGKEEVWREELCDWEFQFQVMYTQLRKPQYTIHISFPSGELPLLFDMVSLSHMPGWPFAKVLSSFTAWMAEPKSLISWLLIGFTSKLAERHFLLHTSCKPPGPILIPHI
jgi:hypothetical protein